MKNTVIKAAFVASFSALGGCSTYNSYAPDRAKIENSETKTEATTVGAESSLWNPFSWKIKAVVHAAWRYHPPPCITYK